MTKIYFLLVFIVSLIIAIMTNNIDTLNETDGTNHIPRLLNIFTVVKFANTMCNSSLGRSKYFEKKSHEFRNNVSRDQWNMLH